jgi:hypothetical protein
MALSTTIDRTIDRVNNLLIGVIVLGALLGVTATAAAAAERDSIRVNVDRLQNGIYLYGESMTPETIGKEYIIFETKNSQTIGAIYLPHSEFSCFKGNFSGNRMNISLIDSYDRQVYKYKLTLGSKNTLTASKQPMMGSPTYQLVGKHSDNDLRMLKTCKTELGN